QTQQAWQAMESLVAAGKKRQLGISNCYQLRQLQTPWGAAPIKPAVLQNRVYADTGYDRGLRAYCGAQGILSPRFWALTANPRILTHSAVAALAGKYQRTAAQIIFRYLTQIDVAPLTGTRSVAHMREDLSIFDFRLAERELTDLTTLL